MNRIVARNNETNGTITCYRDNYEITMMPGSSKPINLEVHSSLNTNNFCNLNLKGPWTMQMDLSFIGFSHYMIHDELPPCQSGGVVIVDEKIKQSHFCHSMTIFPDTLYTSLNMLIFIRFNAGYSSGSVKFTIFPLDYFPSVLNFDQFKCTGDLCSYTSKIWNTEFISIVDGEFQEQTSYRYILIYPNTLLVTSPGKEDYHFTIKAGSLDRTNYLGVISIDVSLTCLRSTLCKTEVALHSKVDDVISTQTNNFIGSTTWHNIIPETIHCIINIRLTDIEEIHLEIEIAKVQECSYSTEGNYARQLPYNKCKVFTIPYFVGNAHIALQTFQSITIGVDPLCDIKECFNLTGVAKPSNPFFPTLTWQDTKLEHTQFHIERHGDIRLSWSTDGVCENNDDINNEPQHCDIQISQNKMRHVYEDGSIIISRVEKEYVAVRVSQFMEELAFRNV